MHKHVFHNDRVLPLEEVRLSPGQAGLLNGWGIFSTLRIYQGVPFGLERHWERLRRDAERINLPLPYDRELVRKAISQLLEANGVEDGCLRIYFVYNRIGVWCSHEQMPATDPRRAGDVERKRPGESLLTSQIAAHSQRAAKSSRIRKYGSACSFSISI